MKWKVGLPGREKGTLGRRKRKAFHQEIGEETDMTDYRPIRYS